MNGWSAPAVLLLLTFVDILLLGCNILVLWIVIKLYTEILKIEQVKTIGRLAGEAMR